MNLPTEPHHPYLSLLIVFLLVGLQGCGTGDLGFPQPLTLWNQSQYELLEVSVHPGPNSEGAPNLAEAGLLPGERLEVPEFMSGSFVTVVRRRVGVGDRIAVSTEEGVEVPGPGYTLVIYDTSFRLLEPDSPLNTP